MGDYLTFRLSAGRDFVDCAVDESTVSEVVFGASTSRLPMSPATMIVGLCAYQESVYSVYNLNDYLPSSAWISRYSAPHWGLSSLPVNGSYLLCDFVVDGRSALSAFLIDSLGEIRPREEFEEKTGPASIFGNIVLVDKKIGKEYIFVNLRNIIELKPSDVIAAAEYPVQKNI